MPAVLISAPTGGADAARESRAVSPDPSSVTSQARPKAWTPDRSATSSAASLAPASSRSRIATFQPSAARAWAVPRPMPRWDAAPVTMAVRSEWDMVVPSRWCCWRASGGGGWVQRGGGQPGEVAADLGNDGVGGESVAVVQGGQCSGGEELVGQCDRDDALSSAGVGEGGGDGLGEAADDGVVLQGDDQPVG